MDKHINVTTPECIECGQSSVVRVNAQAYYDWQHGELIQNAFPNTDEDFRELLITGIHPECFDGMFKEEY